MTVSVPSKLSQVDLIRLTRSQVASNKDNKLMYREGRQSRQIDSIWSTHVNPSIRVKSTWIDNPTWVNQTEIDPLTLSTLLFCLLAEVSCKPTSCTTDRLLGRQVESGRLRTSPPTTIRLRLGVLDNPCLNILLTCGDSRIPLTPWTSCSRNLALSVLLNSDRLIDASWTKQDRACKVQKYCIYNREYR